MEEKIKELIRRWGVPLQYVLAMEQCSQLATEISHQLRWGRTGRTSSQGLRIC